MANIIDKRQNSRNKSALNRRRFLQRFKKQIKKAVSSAIEKRKVTDFENGEKISISRKDTKEPIFRHGKGGNRNIILPGNKEFSVGDRIRRPQENSGSAEGGASDDGEGEDEFIFEISTEEFLNVFFEDLELPFLVRKKISTTKTNKLIRAGFTNVGIPTNLNIVRSMRQALTRKIALKGPIKKKIKEVNAMLERESDKEKKQKLLLELEKLNKRKKNIPFLDPIDLRYNNKVIRPAPSSQAVMFCLMDVSGSMDEKKKDIAKRFFILLYLFLKKNYEKIEVVFIRHHTSAREVSEEDFFYSKETGGTVVSSAIEMMNDIIRERYPVNEWNIYGAQASDGDNWSNDSPYCRDLLVNQIMPVCQYYAYVEILPRHHQSLWEEYLIVSGIHPNFKMQEINNYSDIYSVFRDLFKRQENHVDKVVNG